MTLDRLFNKIIFRNVLINFDLSNAVYKVTVFQNVGDIKKETKRVCPFLSTPNICIPLIKNRIQNSL